jgi:hypothetical protein
MIDTDTITVIRSWMTPTEAYARYRTTPTWEPRPGASVHVGNGLWASACHDCPETVYHWGTMPAYATIGPHEVSAHQRQVPGINVGLLP